MVPGKPAIDDKWNDEIRSQEIFYGRWPGVCSKPILLVVEEKQGKAATQYVENNGRKISVHQIGQGIHTQENKSCIPENKGSVQLIDEGDVAKQVADKKKVSLVIESSTRH